VPELAAEFRKYPAVFSEERIFPPEPGTRSERQRVDKSFATILELAGIKDFRFHDLRHTFASWYMMNIGDLHELAKVLFGALEKLPTSALQN
jgi:integrase